MARRPAAPAPLDPAVRARQTAEFRQRRARAGYPTLVQHILGNMSQAHGVPLGVLKAIARSVRAEREHDQAGRPASPPQRPVEALALLAIVDGANLALVRTALGERGYQALIVVEAALRHQLGRQDALGGLVRARDELLGILERLGAEDAVEEATRLGTATTNLFADIYRELAEDEPPAAAVGEG